MQVYRNSTGVDDVGPLSAIATTAICFKMNPFSPRLGGAWTIFCGWYGPTLKFQNSDSLASASLGASDLSPRYFFMNKRHQYKKSMEIAYSGNKTKTLHGTQSVLTCRIGSR